MVGCVTMIVSNCSPFIIYPSRYKRVLDTGHDPVVLGFRYFNNNSQSKRVTMILSCHYNPAASVRGFLDMESAGYFSYADWKLRMQKKKKIPPSKTSVKEDPLPHIRGRWDTIPNMLQNLFNWSSVFTYHEKHATVLWLQYFVANNSGIDFNKT